MAVLRHRVVFGGSIFSFTFNLVWLVFKFNQLVCYSKLLSKVKVDLFRKHDKYQVKGFFYLFYADNLIEYEFDPQNEVK